jgi:hypothetical protein
MWRSKRWQVKWQILTCINSLKITYIPIIWLLTICERFIFQETEKEITVQRLIYIPRCKLIWCYYTLILWFVRFGREHQILPIFFPNKAFHFFTSIKLIYTLVYISIFEQLFLSPSAIFKEFMPHLTHKCYIFFSVCRWHAKFSHV